jgi:hypothetical protein
MFRVGTLPLAFRVLPNMQEIRGMIIMDILEIRLLMKTTNETKFVEKLQAKVKNVVQLVVFELLHNKII